MAAESPTTPFARRVLVTLGLAVLVASGALLVIAAHQALLVVFLGVLFGVLLHGAAGVLSRLIHVRRWWTLRGLLLAGVAVLVAVVWAWGEILAEQFGELLQELPAALTRAREAGGPLSGLPDPAQLLQNVDVGRITGFFSSMAGALASLFVIGFVGLYLALAPHTYVDNATRLFPPSTRARAVEVLGACHRALERWLLARLADMGIVGVLTGIGLAVLGIPFALPLAITAGLLAFVPYVGPLLSVAPAALVALQGGTGDVVSVVLLYAGVQLLESFAVRPSIEGRSVDVPPAMVLAVQAIFAVLTGAIGVVVATPLTVLAVVLVQTLWIEARLQEDVELLGET